jgi:hypothetical protein
MHVVVAAGAKLDIAESYTCYEKRSAGWCGDFRKCILEDLFQLEATAGIHRIIIGYHHIKSAALNPNSAIRGASVVVMLGVTGLFDPLGLYQKDTAPRSGKNRGPMIVANGVSPIAEFGLNSIIYYRMEPDAAVVVVILDGRINPAKRDRILKQR